MQIVLMIMMVLIGSQRVYANLAEQCPIGRITADMLRVAFTANVLIQAQHMIGLRHYPMQIMRHHQHTTAMTLAHRPDQILHRGLTR